LPPPGAYFCCPLSKFSGNKQGEGIVQIELNVNPTTWLNAIDGYKIYIGCAVAAAEVIANHFGWLPPQYVPANLDGANWISDLTAIYFAAGFRSALKKNSIASLLNKVNPPPKS
jgi:hypothetical protein